MAGKSPAVDRRRVLVLGATGAASLRAMGIDGQIFECEGEGLLARCLLHENDHLTGKLLVDFVGPLKRQMIKKKLQRLKADEAEEVA